MNARAAKSNEPLWRLSGRNFAWLCLLVFAEVFIFYAALTYYVLTPQYVDIPDLARSARKRPSPQSKMTRDWLREGEWKWPLGGDMLVLPNALSIRQTSANPNSAMHWIEDWWRDFLAVDTNESEICTESIDILKPQMRNMARLDKKRQLADALRDYGPLLVKVKGRDHVLIGDFTDSIHNKLFLVLKLESGKTDFVFVGVDRIEQARAFPHPLQHEWVEQDSRTILLKIFDPLGRPLKLRPSREITLYHDGMVTLSDAPGEYVLRIPPNTSFPVQVQIYHEYLMPREERRMILIGNNPGAATRASNVRVP